VILSNGNPIVTNADACQGSALPLATHMVKNAVRRVRELAMVLVTAGRAGLGMLQMERTQMRTCADANQAGENNRKKIPEIMVHNVEPNMSVNVELIAMIADQIGSLVLALIVMANADAHPGRSEKSSGVLKDAQTRQVSVALIVAIAVFLGRLATLMAQPLTADARTGGETIEQASEKTRLLKRPRECLKHTLHKFM